MKRRTFVKAATVASCHIPIISGCRATSKNAIQTNDDTLNSDDIGGYALEDLRKQYHHDLFDDFLPFIDSFIYDPEYGGFMCNTDRDGTNITGNKRPYYDGRGIWVYSFLYRHFAPEPRYLEVARKTVEFLMRHEPSGDSMWPAEFTRDGKPLAPSGNLIYADAFLATGLQEYAKATGEMKWWNKARDILFKLVRLYDRRDYYPDFASAYYYLGEGAPSMTGPRCIGE
ncbi:hypothetical protein ACFL47_10145, partial [Candidatus Latescibacterota bacterium]